MPGLRALALIGSRARGDSRADSDWDFAFLARAGEGGEVSDALRDLLTRQLGTDAVDVVDLGRASGVMRFRAARDGRWVYEAAPHAWDDFCVEASLFWCDAGPTIEAAQRAFLDGLGPVPGGVRP